MVIQVLPFHGHTTAVVVVVAIDDVVRADINMGIHIMFPDHLCAANYWTRKEIIHASIAMLALYKFLCTLYCTVYTGDVSFGAIKQEMKGEFIAL